MKLKKIQRTVTAALLLAVLLLSAPLPCFAAAGPRPDAAPRLDAAVAELARWTLQAVPRPQVGSIGGEWAVLALARSGEPVPSPYFEDYYATVERYVKACKGRLHEKKYTEYARLIVTLSALGKDPADVGGYNLLTPLGDYDKTIWQGLNGPIWALIALNAGDYPMPQNKEAKTQATKELYLQRILDCQLPDGGWSLFGGTAAAAAGDGSSDPDITGMALQALSFYQARGDVQTACNRALACMSLQQKPDGGFASWGTQNSESCVQMLVALGELGIPLDDSRFVKNGHTMLDNLLSFYRPGNGFLHTANGSGSNLMASEQGFYGLVAARRLETGKPALYHMTDPLQIAPSTEGLPKGAGLPQKHRDVQAQPIAFPQKTFDDITGPFAHPNQPAIEALAARGLLSGKSDRLFDPDAPVTRGEFAKLVVTALGLSPKSTAIFSDVPENLWYNPYIGTAFAYGIAQGTDATHFQPEAFISKEEAAVMVARAARLCGMDTAFDPSAARNILAQFTDYPTCAVWARPALAFCCKEGLLPADSMELLPRQVMKRCAIAQMLFQLLGSANLL